MEIEKTMSDHKLKT